jgi:hypothetical protein
MRVSLRILLASVLLAILAAPPAAAATIQDLIKLKAAGLSDEILIALIEADGTVFHLKADDVIAIRKDGLSEKVIMAMLSTAIKRPPVIPAPAPATTAPPRTGSAAVPAPTQPAPPAPTVTVDDPYAPPDQSTQISVPPSLAPVTINVTQKVEQKVEAPRERTYDNALYTTYPYYYVGVPALRPVVPVAPAPVYWGFGGVRRPGTWRD